MLIRIIMIAAFIAALLAGGCSENPPANASPAQVSEADVSDTPSEAVVSDTPSADSVMPSQEQLKPWKGDFDGMAERRVVRALVVYSRTLYFLDGAEQHGVTYDTLKEFENVINKQLKTGTLKVQVAFIPVTRDQLLPALLDGRGDIAAALMSITGKRLESVDFSDPLLTGVRELVVTGPTAGPIAALDDLSGREVHVNRSSNYYESLSRLNEQFRATGKPPIKLMPVDNLLESDDILEMLNAGLIGTTVVDSHIAELWARVFDKITVHNDLAVNTGGEIAWAFRKDSPILKGVVNSFVKDHKLGTSFGNQILSRYLKNVNYIKNSTTDDEIKKYHATVSLFQRYGTKYDFDYLMLAAQAYQESGIDQNARSPAGAVGIMQIKPATAADPSIGITDVETNAENNIHAGVKYLRHVIDQYFKDADMDNKNKLLFAFASYNAGPARIARLRDKARAEGLDPNVWFRNVEYVAAMDIGRETVQYVSNIYKYYIAYRRVAALRQKKNALKNPG